MATETLASPSARFIADRHRGWRWAPVRWAVRAGLALRLKLETRKS